MRRRMVDYLVAAAVLLSFVVGQFASSQATVISDRNYDGTVDSAAAVLVKGKIDVDPAPPPVVVAESPICKTSRQSRRARCALGRANNCTFANLR